MTAAALLADLRARGVAVEARGDRLRVVPAERVTVADLDAMHRLKPALLTLLRRESLVEGPDDAHRSLLSTWRTLPLPDRRRLEAEADAGNPLAGTVLERVACNPDAVAWRLWSDRLHRGLWIARDLAALRDLEREGLGGLPVVLADDLERIGVLDDLTLHAVLDTCAAWPGCRVVDAVPKGGG